MATADKIIYTKTDEAPMLATYSFLPIINAFSKAAGVTVEVADRGPGVPPGEEQRLFDKLYRGQPAGVRRGFGLGLAICRGILEAHGGHIWVENRPAGGATFRFTLPLQGSPPPMLPEPESPADLSPSLSHHEAHHR